MPRNLEMIQVSDRVGEKPVNPVEAALELEPPATDAPARVDEIGQGRVWVAVEALEQAALQVRFGPFGCDRDRASHDLS